MADSPVDNETRELIVRLLTRAGMIMEDASAEAVLAGGADISLRALVQRLQTANEAVASILSASSALLVSNEIEDKPHRPANQD